MLRLITDQQSPENPTIGVRWCLDPKDKQTLRDLKAPNPHVLILVKYENSSLEDRQLLPLGAAMTFITFRLPGKHRIFARLFWGEKVEKIQEFFLDRQSRYIYSNNVLNYEGNAFRSGLGAIEKWDGYKYMVDSGYTLIDHFEMDVEVGKEHFAKEPPQWLKRWVNMPYVYEPADQCQFRKRMLFAFTLQPPLTLLYIIVRSISCLALAFWGILVCARGLTLRPMFHPFASEVGDVWPKIRRGESYHPASRSAWILEDKNGKERIWTFFVSPLFFLIVFVVLTALGWYFEMGYMQLISIGAAWFWSESVKLVQWINPLVVLNIVLAVAGIVFAFFIIDRSLGWYQRKKVNKNASKRKLEADPEYQSARKREAEEKRLKSLQDAFEYLQCPADPQPALKVDIKALPPERRTLRLRFLDLKRSVCRPYAR